MGDAWLDPLRAESRFREVMRRAEQKSRDAEVAFPEIARQIDAGASFDEVTRKTGCGTTCTACLPDLRESVGRASAMTGIAARAVDSREGNRRTRRSSIALAVHVAARIMSLAAPGEVVSRNGCRGFPLEPHH